jgi:hypothetical protein
VQPLLLKTTRLYLGSKKFSHKVGDFGRGTRGKLSKTAISEIYFSNTKVTLFGTVFKTSNYLFFRLEAESLVDFLESA